MKALGALAVILGLGLVVFFVAPVSASHSDGAATDAHLVITSKSGVALGSALVVTGSILLALWRRKKERKAGKQSL